MKKTYTILSVLFISTLSIAASARTVRETTYRYDQIWSTTVRFLRVDSGFAVIEQDKGTGYVMFEYLDGGRSLHGAVELIPLEKNGAESVQLGLRIQDMPTYVENVLMDKLVRKLRDEYGEPPRPRLVKSDSARPVATPKEADKPEKESGKKPEKDNIDIDDDD